MVACNFYGGFGWNIAFTVFVLYLSFFFFFWYSCCIDHNFFYRLSWEKKAFIILEDHFWLIWSDIWYTEIHNIFVANNYDPNSLLINQFIHVFILRDYFLAILTLYILHLMLKPCAIYLWFETLCINVVPLLVFLYLFIYFFSHL